MWRNVFSVCIFFFAEKVCAFHGCEAARSELRDPPVPSSRKDRHMAYEGKKADGKYYLWVSGRYVEVSEEVYYGYMRSVWAEKKSNERTNRCYKVNEGRRCTKRCDKCEYFRSGTVVSLDCMMEDSNFDIEDRKRRSVEDTVIMKLMIEALYEEIGRLEPDDRFLIWGLFLKEEPMTQQEVATELGISQVMVFKRRERILNTLHEALKDWED